MKVLRLQAALLLILFIAVCGQAGAQFRTNATSPSEPPPAVLYPEPTYWFLGFIVGADINQHAGDFVTILCDRFMNEASGDGLHIGVQLEHRLNELFSVAAKLVYNDFSAKGEYAVSDVPTLLRSDGEPSEMILLDHVYSSEVKLSYMVFNPMIEFFPVGGLYLMAGPSVGFKITARYNCLDQVPEEYLFEETGTNVAPNIYPEPEIDIPNAESIRLDLRAGIGYNLRLSRSVSVAPELGYIYALTKISDDDDWLAHAYSAVVVLKIDL